MKRGIYLTFAIFSIFLLFISISLAADEPTIQDMKKGFSESMSETNPWNETVIISPVWQTLIGGFFGLNLHSESTAISVREAITFFMIFIMFIVIIKDILKITPFFKTKILKELLFFFDGISGEFIAALIITTIISITGAFINLKNIFMEGVAYLVSSLDWGWLNFMIANRGWGIFLTIAIVFPIIFIIHEVLTWGKPIIDKYSQVSKAEAKGRRLGEAINKIESK